VGAALSIAAILTLVYGIIEAPQRGWGARTTLGSFAIAAVLGLVFARRELRTREPMLDLRYFQRPGFLGGSIALSMMFFGMFGMFFLLTQYMQLVKGWSALSAGVRTLPFAVAMMVAAPSSARLAERFGVKTVVSTGIAIAATGMLLMSRAGVPTGYPYLAFTLVVLAGGMGLTMAPSTASIMSSLPLGKAGVGSAMNDTNRELGGALGVAVLGSVLASAYTHRLDPALSGLTPALRASARSSLGGAIGVASTAGRAEIAGVARGAFAHAMSVALVIGAVVALAASALVARVLPQRLGSSEQQSRRGGREVDLPSPADVPPEPVGEMEL
jgi:predicted MFS family arabinose efflux permease